MAKAILFDADGVALKKQPYFSLEIARDNHLPEGLMDAFYRNKLPLCQKGKADIRVELEPFLPQWRWQGSVDDFLRRWFTTDVIPDETVLHRIDMLRIDGFPCYLASDQEQYRAAYILDTMGLGKRFDGAFFSHTLGYLKSEPGFFRDAALLLNLQPGDILYFDDDAKNVETAKRGGIDAHFWTGLETLKEAGLS